VGSHTGGGNAPAFKPPLDATRWCVPAKYHNIMAGVLVRRERERMAGVLVRRERERNWNSPGVGRLCRVRCFRWTR
jgi:hypothetical protein